MESTRFERRILITLSVMLVGVFIMSINMYDTVEEGTSNGTLAVFAEAARDFVYENDAVAAFLGIEEEMPEEDLSLNVEAEALAYVERYNRVYGDFQESN